MSIVVIVIIIVEFRRMKGFNLFKHRDNKLTLVSSSPSPTSSVSDIHSEEVVIVKEWFSRFRVKRKTAALILSDFDGLIKTLVVLMLESISLHLLWNLFLVVVNFGVDVTVTIVLNCFPLLPWKRSRRDLLLIID
jgi:hypothetical protein